MQITPPCLLWDVDGTLIDTTDLIVDALDHIYRRYYGQTLDYEARRALIGTPLKKQIRVFGEPETFGTDEPTVTAEFIAYYESHRDQERILTDVTTLLIEGKQRGFPTALVTSKNREELRNTLPRLGIAEYVDLAVTADDILRPKPAPDGLLLALQSLNIPHELAQNAFYIGDTVHDMRAAFDAGVRGVGVTWGAAARPLLEAAGAAHICTTPAELRTLLFPTE